VTFGQVEKVDLTAGARYTWDKEVFDTEVFVAGGLPYLASPTTLLACVAPDGTVLGSMRPCTAEELAQGFVDTPVRKHLYPTFDAFTPRLAIGLKARDDVLVYGSASRGFKSGALDGRTNTGAAAPPSSTHQVASRSASASATDATPTLPMPDSLLARSRERSFHTDESQRQNPRNRAPRATTHATSRSCGALAGWRPRWR
jgi:iron complex outermembrane receptor protein